MSYETILLPKWLSHQNFDKRTVSQLTYFLSYAYFYLAQSTYLWDTLYICQSYILENSDRRNIILTNWWCHLPFKLQFQFIRKQVVNSNGHSEMTTAKFVFFSDWNSIRFLIGMTWHILKSISYENLIYYYVGN